MVIAAVSDYASWLDAVRCSVRVHQGSLCGCSQYGAFDAPQVRVQIDREADLLNRGRSRGAHAALRDRIAALFLAFLETPEFNPEAAALHAAPAAGAAAASLVAA